MASMNYFLQFQNEICKYIDLKNNRQDVIFFLDKPRNDENN